MPSHCSWGEDQNPYHHAFLSNLVSTLLLSPVLLPEMKPGLLILSLQSIPQWSLLHFLVCTGPDSLSWASSPNWRSPRCLARQVRESCNRKRPIVENFLEKSAAKVTLPSEGSSIRPITSSSGKLPSCIFPSTLFATSEQKLGCH